MDRRVGPAFAPGNEYDHPGVSVRDVFGMYALDAGELRPAWVTVIPFHLRVSVLQGPKVILRRSISAERADFVSCEGRKTQADEAGAVLSHIFGRIEDL